MKRSILLVTLFLLPLSAFADKFPTIFYLTSRPSIQAGVIRDFNDDRVQVLHENIRDTGIKACIHPESGRYVLSVTTSGFENFDFGDPGHYFILGDISKGAVGWTIPETNFKGKDYAESSPKFSLDGSHFFTSVTFRNNTVISAYEFQTGASERIFYNRWPRMFSRGIPSAVLSTDEKRVVFSAVRGRRLELYNWYFQAASEPPSMVLKLKEVPFDIYPGKNLLVYKTTQALKRKVKRTSLSFYDMKISENYKIFPYADTESSGSENPWQDYAVDEKNKLLFTVNRSEGRSRIYRVNMHTLKVDPFYPNALRIFDISRDGRYLLYTRYRDEAELSGSAGNSWREDPQVIAVLDLQTRECHQMEVPEALSYNYLAFTYR